VAVMADQQATQASDVLAPYAPEHDERTVRWLNAPDIQASFGLRRALSLDAHRRWVDAATDTRIWAIVGPAGQHVGNALLKIHERHRSGYFQIYIGEPNARGRGLGEQALRAVLRAAFEDHGLHRVWLHTFADNARAEALYQKVGFLLEGVEREALWMDGAFVSQRRWSLLAHEWRGAVSAGAQP